MKRVITIAGLLLSLLSCPSWAKGKEETVKSPFPVLTSTIKPDAVAANEKFTVQVEDETVAVPVGTKIRLQIQQNLRGNKTTIGQEVKYKVYEDVVSPNGKILIQKGAAAVGKVTYRKGAKGFGKSSELTFNAESVTAVDGNQIPVTFSFSQDARNKGFIRVNFILNPFAKGGDAKVRINSICEAFVGTPPPTAETADAKAKDTKNDSTNDGK